MGSYPVQSKKSLSSLMPNNSTKILLSITLTAEYPSQYSKVGRERDWDSSECRVPRKSRVPLWARVP